MNEESAKRGIEAVEAFIETFNAQDHERHAETLNVSAHPPGQWQVHQD